MPITFWREAFDDMLHGVLADGQDYSVDLPLTYADMYAFCQSMYDRCTMLATK